MMQQLNTMEKSKHKLTIKSTLKIRFTVKLTNIKNTM